MTLVDRAAAFARKFPNRAAHLSVVMEQRRPVLYGRWLLGQNYQGTTKYYGEYPPHFLERVMALFPDADGDVLHAFSGSLPPGKYCRCDLHEPAELQCNVLELPTRVRASRGRADSCAGWTCNGRCTARING